MKNGLEIMWDKVKTFFRKYGIDAVIALVIWYAPSWLVFFMPSLKPFALTWLALLTSPIIPVVIVVPITAVFIHWLRKKIWESVLYAKDQLDKVQMQNQMAAYFTRDEMRLILDKGKVMYTIKQIDKKAFTQKQNDKRHNLIVTHWEITLEEAEK